MYVFKKSLVWFCSWPFLNNVHLCISITCMYITVPNCPAHSVCWMARQI